MKTVKIFSLILLLVGLNKLTIAQPLPNDSLDIADSVKVELASTTPQSISAVNTFQFDDSAFSKITTKGVLIVFSIFSVGILLGGWLVFFFSKRKIYSILEEERVYYLDYPPLRSEKSIFHYITLFHILKRRKDSYKSHSSELKKQMDELETENIELKKKN